MNNMTEKNIKSEKKAKITKKASTLTNSLENKNFSESKTTSNATGEGANTKTNTQSVNNEPTYTNRVTRNESDKILGGVASGIARYINVDPLIIRLAFVALVLGEGLGIVIYLVLWILIPSEKSTQQDTKKVISENAKDIEHQAEQITNNMQKNTNKNTAKIILGSVLILIGLLIQLNILGLSIDFSWAWPIIIIAIGLIIIFKRN